MPNSLYKSLIGTYTFDELLTAFSTLVTKIQVLREKLSFPDEDARQIALYGLQEILVGFGLTAHSIIWQRTSDDVIKSFQNKAVIEGKTDEDVLSIVEKTWRLSLITLCHFKIDSLFQNLLKALGQEPGKNGFSKNKKNLMKKITPPEPEEVNKVLNTLTHIRNSLHNNGIHRGDTCDPIELLGCAYEFETDKVVCCASFWHIFTALDCSIDVIEQILFAPEIQALPKVNDLYVQLNP